MEDDSPLPSKIQSQKISFNHAPKELLNIAQNNPNGFTVDLEGNHIAEGFAVARIETQDETEALVLAVERQQIAIFNLTKRIEIRINKQ